MIISEVRWERCSDCIKEEVAIPSIVINKYAGHMSSGIRSSECGRVLAEY